RSLTLRCEHVFRAGMGPCGPGALPYGQLIRPALDEPPVNVKVDPSHVYPLAHLITDAWRTVVGVDEPAVNGDPVTETVGIHDHVPHVRGWCGDAGADGDDAHQRAAPRSKLSNSPSACSTAESNECSSTPRSSSA